MNRNIVTFFGALPALVMLLAATTGAQHGAFRQCLNGNLIEAQNVLRGASTRAVEDPLIAMGAMPLARAWAAEALIARCAHAGRYGPAERPLVAALWHGFVRFEKKDTVLELIAAQNEKMRHGLKAYTAADASISGPRTERDLKCLLKTRNGDFCGLSLGEAADCPSDLFRHCTRAQEAQRH